ncbi:MAG: phenylacetate--CoA ligase [Thermoguttaceae bacterium]|nr:phenylacetate--CoA ligase [Thermoguttaceae bacterium]
MNKQNLPDRYAPNTPFHPASFADFLPTEQLRQIQSQRLRHTVRRAYEHVRFYRDRMDKRGLTPEDIRSVEDISKFSFTVKNDLRDTYPFGLFASPMEEIVRLHASSGTTGKPIVVAYTQQDIEVWKEVVKRAFLAYGLHRRDIIQVAYGYGLFTGGLGAHYGAEALGATVIPISGGNTERQIMLMRDFGATAICCTPSYFLHLIGRAEEMGIDLHDLPIRAGAFGAEPWTDEMRQRIEESSGIKAYNIYGLSEIIGPGVAAECHCQEGLHIFEDHFYPEIINPDTGEVLPDGTPGELVLTTLSKEAMPMLRYRTRDLTMIMTEPCACGRTIRRIRRIVARSDDMFIIRGVNVFPSQIEAALLSIKEALPHYQIVLTREKGLDQIEVQIEVSSESANDDRVRVVEDLRDRIAMAIKETINIRVKVTLKQPNTLPRSEGKIQRVIDQRQL